MLDSPLLRGTLFDITLKFYYVSRVVSRFGMLLEPLLRGPSFTGERHFQPYEFLSGPNQSLAGYEL